MRIGIIGAGQLGLCLGVAAAVYGEHEVFLTDADPKRQDPLWLKRGFEWDDGRDVVDLIHSKAGERLYYGSLDYVAAQADIIFICVQTPHASGYDGTTPGFCGGEDFDYSFLQEACGELFATGYSRIACVVSTVLPGTMDKLIVPMQRECSLVYSPQFIAMGQAVADFRRPDIVVTGGPEEEACEKVANFFRKLTVVGRGMYIVIPPLPYKDVEAIKILYNTFISLKLGFANSVQVLSDIWGLNSQMILGALQNSHRIVSSAYLSPGMGDGGGCHPRDNLALGGAMLGTEEGCFNFPSYAMEVRDSYAVYLKRLILTHVGERLIVMLGARYKNSSPLTIGSHALLLYNYLLQDVPHGLVLHDPKAVGSPSISLPPNKEALYFVGVCDPDYNQVPFRPGDVVIDPWGIIKPVEGVKLIRVGMPDAEA